MIDSNRNFIRENKRKKYWKGLVSDGALEVTKIVERPKERDLSEIREIIKNNVNNIVVCNDTTNEYEVYFE